MYRVIMAAIVVCVVTSSANAAVYHFFNGEKLKEAALEWEKSQAYPKDSDLLLVNEFATSNA